MTANEIALFVLAGLIMLLVWYVDTHSADKPRRERERRRAKPVTKKPAYEQDDGKVTLNTLSAVTRRVPQGRGKSIKPQHIHVFLVSRQGQKRVSPLQI